MRVVNAGNLYRSIAGVLLSLLFVSCSVSGQYEIATFDLGKQRSIQILASEYIEVTQSIYYQVKVDGKVVIPLFMICSTLDHGQLDFQALLARDGDLVGVFEKELPQEILVVHDFKTNASWPRVLSYNSTDEYYQFGAALLKQLQAEHPNLELKLGSDRACD